MSVVFTTPVVFGWRMYFESASVTRGERLLDWIVDGGDILVWLGSSHIVLSRERQRKTKGIDHGQDDDDERCEFY